MGINLTAEQIQKEHIEAMGKDFGLVYNRLYHEIIFIHHKWSEFEDLFCQDNGTIASMNKLAPFFFYIVKNNLFNDIILSICKITDRKSTSGKTNLTIQLFPEHVDDEIKGLVSNIVKEIINDSLFCRDRRNRLISHLDKELALNQSATPLKSANRNKVNALLKKFEQLISTIEHHYFDAETYFGIQRSEGSLLLKWAEDGLRFDNLKWKYIETGKLDPSDFIDRENKT